MQDRISDREMAEDDAIAALAQLPIDDAMEAIARLHAVLLAGMGIMPGTPAFERLAVAYLARLAEQTAAMTSALRATTH